MEKGGPARVRPLCTAFSGRSGPQGQALTPSSLRQRASWEAMKSLFADFRRQTLLGFLLFLLVNQPIQRVERVGEAAETLDETAGHCFFPVEHAANIGG